MSDIYNKNAREKALLEEAYTSVYNESAVDVELDHWWDFDIDDVIRKVYHGAQGTLPPEQGTPEYEENSEKIFIWLKDKYPQPDDYDIDKVEFRSRTADDATEWANRVSRDPESRFYDPKHDEDAEHESREERADVDKYEYEQGKEAGELSDDWEKPNYRGDQHDFQPGEIVEVGPWGPGDEADHLEVVLQIKGDQVNTIPITDDAYGVQYGGKDGRDISLIRPQSEIDYDHGDFKPADGREW